MDVSEPSSAGENQSMRERTPRYLRLFTDSVSVWILGSSLALFLGAPIVLLRIGSIDILVLYFLFVLIGGPLSLVYLWPAITKEKHRGAMVNQLQPVFSGTRTAGILVVAAAQLLLTLISVTAVVLVNASIMVVILVTMVILVPVIIRDWVEGE